MQSNFSNYNKKKLYFGQRKELREKGSRSFVHLILLFMWWNYTHFIIQKRAIARNEFHFFIFFFAYDKLIIFLHRMLKGVVWQKEEFEKFVSWYKLLDIIIFFSGMNEQSEITKMLCNLWMNVWEIKLNICFVMLKRDAKIIEN